MAVNPWLKKITTKSIPKALEATNITGKRLAKSTFLANIKYAKPNAPTSKNIP